MNNEELKPCPFCGVEAEVFNYNIKCDFYEDEENEYIAPFKQMSVEEMAALEWLESEVTD